MCGLSARKDVVIMFYWCLIVSVVSVYHLSGEKKRTSLPSVDSFFGVTPEDLIMVGDLTLFVEIV